jgi:hypothetical protein
VRGNRVAVLATSSTIAGSAAAMRPTMKNVALVQWASSALRTAWV